MDQSAAPADLDHWCSTAGTVGLRLMVVRSGKIRALRGGVVDVAFEGGVPALHNRLESASTVMEVVSHLNENVVRVRKLSTRRMV